MQLLKKPILIFILIILGLVGIYLVKHLTQEEHSMKLIHLKSGFIVAEYKEGRTIIYDRLLEKEMAVRGIAIPPALRNEYGGKSTVRSSDKEFQKAFKELYASQAFNSQSYRWEE